MSTFSPEELTRQLLTGIMQDVTDEIKVAVMQSAEIRSHLSAFKDDTELTLRAILLERDPAQLVRLQESLSTTLPARKSAILSASVSLLSSDAQALFERIVATVVRVALVAAKSFVPPS